MLLDIRDLTVDFGTRRPVLREVSLAVAAGEVVGLVGESGSGKSTTAKAVLRMFPASARTSGTVLVEGEDVLAMGKSALREHRARRVGMVYQDPRSSLNPVRRIGDFLTERMLPGRTSAVDLLEQVGLAERHLRRYPHELSGGMLQRVVIAGALAAEPRLLLADEATSALDVTTQAEILALLRTAQRDRGLGMLFITHDLHLAAAYCDRVYVMYAGHVVEHQGAEALFARPRHPYTKGLLGCTPALDDDRPLEPIQGRPPSLDEALPGCPFTPRCPLAEAECEQWQVRPEPIEGGHAACRRVQEVSSA